MNSRVRHSGTRRQSLLRSQARCAGGGGPQVHPAERIGAWAPPTLMRPITRASLIVPHQVAFPPIATRRYRQTCLTPLLFIRQEARLAIRMESVVPLPSGVELHARFLP